MEIYSKCNYWDVYLGDGSGWGVAGERWMGENGDICNILTNLKKS